MIVHHEIKKKAQNHSANWGILNDFESISLEKMDEVRMMKRYDSKFFISEEMLKSVLKDITNDYFVLEIAGTKIQSYNTVYYDTPDNRFYLDHHNGYSKRMKLRKREYSDSGTVFLEVKEKNNKGETRKKRMETNSLKKGLSEEETRFVKQNTNLKGVKLEPKFNSRFKRITLVSKRLDERCTIDIELHFNSYGAEKNDLTHMAIVELKQNQQFIRSKLARVLKENKVYKLPFSKYCLGRALNEEGLKNNVFKPEIQEIKNQIK